MQDMASFHGFLAVHEFIWANTYGSSLQLKVIYHKVECIRNINNCLNEYEPPSEGTIYAVMVLWAIEVLTNLVILLSLTN